MFVSWKFAFECAHLKLPDELRIEPHPECPEPVTAILTKVNREGTSTTFACTLLLQTHSSEAVIAGMNLKWEEQTNEVHEFQRKVGRCFLAYSRHVVRTIQWFVGDERHEVRRDGDKFRYSLDRDTWNDFAKAPPGAPSGHVKQVTMLNSEYSGIELTRLIRDQAVPLPHEMIREAGSLERTSPRSCVMLAVSAAEVGFKAFAARAAPTTEWLLSELQSPPLHKMLASYFPKLPVTQVWGVAPFIPKQLRKRLQFAVELRNKIAHTELAQSDLDQANVRAAWQAVWDLFYILDSYSGHDWAWYRISAACRKEIKD